MLLTKLLYQRVKGLGAQGSLPLKPGYVILVSAEPAVRHAVLAALYPGLDGERGIPDGTPGATRIGAGLLPSTGVPSRVLRELGGDRQLQRIDAATKKFATI